MRNYGARLAKLEKAIFPPEPVTIRIVYVDGDDWRDSGKNVKRLVWGDEPIARVAPGLLEKLQDRQLESIVAQCGGDVAQLYQEDDTAAAVSSRPGAVDRQPARATAPSDPTPPAERPWSFQEARYMYKDPPAPPSLRKLRAMARQGRGK